MLIYLLIISLFFSLIVPFIISKLISKKEDVIIEYKTIPEVDERFITI